MKFIVDNMKCSGCTSAVQAKLQALEGVEGITIDLTTKTAEVQGRVDADLVIETLTEAGYPTELADQ
ncbi:MAG: heavy-metal-associated domain-containing protein [Thiothrix sp.]|nr:MAG: heavy-metal-associated domain-containing protein [Thiothrix sp.]